MKNKRLISILFASCLGICLFLSFSNDTQAQGGFEYAYLAEFENDGTCFWVANVCTSDSGSTCTTPGSKSRGIKYCFPL